MLQKYNVAIKKLFFSFLGIRNCLRDLYYEQGTSSMESVNVWSALTEALVNGESAQKMRETKRRLEEAQRELQQKRLASGIVWSPKYFRSTKEGTWVWHDESMDVPHAPLVVR
jgi:hypothetical protein